MKKNVLFISFIFAASISCSVTRHKISMVPDKYFIPSDTADLSESKTYTDNPWKVYSDRNENQSYKDPLGREPFRTLNYLDGFYVVEEKGEWIKIYKESEDEPFTLKLSKKAEYYGWVRKDQVLLWTSCIENEDHIKRKVMIMNPGGTTEKVMLPAADSLVSFHINPQLTAPSLARAGLFDIFYLYKYYPDSKNPKSVLLGNHQRIREGRVAEEIVGWVDFGSLIYWDHPVFVLPNTDINAIEERHIKGISSMVFGTESAAVNFAMRQRVNDSSILWNADISRSVYTGNYLRFPVLWDQTKIDQAVRILKVGVIGKTDATDSVLKLTHPALERNGVIPSLQGFSADNIVIVLDGTSEMAPYFSRLTETLAQVVKRIYKQKKSTVRFAVVVCKDNGNHNPCTEVIPLTISLPEIINGLKKIRINNHRSKNSGETLFKGLKSALTEINVPVDQSNYLFLIGNKGYLSIEEPSKDETIEIANLLAGHNYNFFSFQLHNKEKDSSYFNYIRMSKDILELISQKQYERIRFYKQLHGELSPASPQIKYDERSQKYDMANPKCYGYLMISKPGKPGISMEVINKEMVSAVASINDTINQLLKILRYSKELTALNPGTIDEQEMTERVSYFARAVTTVSKGFPGMQENMKKNDTQPLTVYRTGYIVSTIPEMKFDLWERELFYTRDELYELTQFYSRLTNSTGGFSRRKSLMETWSKLGEEPSGLTTQENTELKTMGEIEKARFGLSGISELLNLKIKDIDDQDKLPVSALIKWMKEIEVKGKVVAKILNNEEPYKDLFSFVSRGQTYYWIPQKLLP